ncbi:MAG: hypothetical protein AAGC79_10265 [Pseudomonadota bacterium]
MDDRKCTWAKDTCEQWILFEERASSDGFMLAPLYSTKLEHRAMHLHGDDFWIFNVLGPKNEDGTRQFVTQLAVVFNGRDGFQSFIDQARNTFDADIEAFERILSEKGS